MNKSLIVVLGAVLTLGASPLGAAAAVGAPVEVAPPPGGPDVPQREHVLTTPLQEEQTQERATALQQVLSGKATPRGANKVVKIGQRQFVELAREDTDHIWTVLGEFSDLSHNAIPKPDRRVDNTTIWTKDFSQPYYRDLLFSEKKGAVSMATFYDELSSGRYSVTGQVENWVKVPGTGASYGDNDLGDAAVWPFLNETVNAWYDGQLAAGKTPAQIDDYLSQFDTWDRYDYDGDGNFDEPDGYIDHFQAVHAGEGEEVGGGVLGDDAIWSHRWYNQTTPIYTGGPTVDGTVVPLGGARVGQSRYWIGDYTVEPENGGVGVFAHEFGHDLGLPDLYDTSGNSGGAENSTGFWSLMSSGSYGNSGRPEDGIGTKPIHMGAWEKLQLGWLDYQVVPYGEHASVTLGPSIGATKNGKQAVVALLPDTKVTTTIGTPYEGSTFWYSGSGNDLNNLMTAPVTLATGSTLSAQVKYDIETDWDYAYVVVSTDGGATWTSVPTSLSTTTNPNGQNFGYGITGDSGDAWVPVTADLSGYTGDVLVGFRYWTDGAVAEPGLQVDAVTINGAPVAGWTLDGFTETNGTAENSYFNAYVAEYRAYNGYDLGLLTGPYSFGDKRRPDWADHYPYQDGLLVTYWNEQYQDNNVGEHPGAGLILPVDAHPGLLYEPTDDEPDNGSRKESWRPRLQSYDSTFGLDRTSAFVLRDPDSGVPGRVGGLPAVRTFDDRKDWYVEPGSAPDADGWSGVDVPKTGTKISVTGKTLGGFYLKVAVN